MVERVPGKYILLSFYPRHVPRFDSERETARVQLYYRKVYVREKRIRSSSEVCFFVYRKFSTIHIYIVYIECEKEMRDRG